MSELAEWDELNALATMHREGWRVFHRDQRAEAAYEIASLPDGRWAVRIKCGYLCGDHHGVAVPWRAHASRDECLAAFLNEARRHFSFRVFGGSKDQQQTQRKMLALLEGVTPGFAEPPPQPVAEEPKAAPDLTTRAKKVQQARRGPVQRELF